MKKAKRLPVAIHLGEDDPNQCRIERLDKKWWSLEKFGWVGEKEASEMPFDRAKRLCENYRFDYTVVEPKLASPESLNTSAAQT